MKLSYHTIVLFITTLFLTQTSLAQENKITIRFIGNCGLHMTDGTTNIYADFPYKSGAYGYMKFNANELERIEKTQFSFLHICMRTTIQEKTCALS